MPKCCLFQYPGPLGKKTDSEIVTNAYMTIFPWKKFYYSRKLANQRAALTHCASCIWRTQKTWKPPELVQVAPKSRHFFPQGPPKWQRLKGGNTWRRNYLVYLAHTRVTLLLTILLKMLPLSSPGHNQIWIYDDVINICKMAPTPRNTREGHFLALCCA